MEFVISCDTIRRLASITSAEYPFIRLEHVPENTLAIASNKKLAVIERIGVNPTNLNGAIHLPMSDALIAQCTSEAPFGGSLHVVVNQILGWATAKTTLGWALAGNAMIVGASEAAAQFNDWREWLPPKITKSVGGMFWNVDSIARLAAASPSGSVVFPEHIDVNKPVLIRDIIDDKWIGLTMGNRFLSNGTVENAEPAKLPKWFK